VTTPIDISRTVADRSGESLVAVRAEVARRAAAGDPVVDLTGEGPRRAFPRTVTDAAARVWRTAGHVQPEPTGGLEVRAAIARHLSLLSGGRPVNADHLVLAPSSQMNAFAAGLALVESGDHVVVPTPAPSSWAFSLRLARAVTVPVPGDPEWSLKISVDDVARVSDARTAGLVLQSPANPTGAVYTRSELKALLEWAASRDLWVIADESYRSYHYGSGPAPSVLDLPDDLLRRTVVLTDIGSPADGLGVSASLAMQPVARAQARVLAWLGGSVPPAADVAVRSLLVDERRARERDAAAETMRRSRDAAVEFLRVRLPGVEFIDPLGGLFLFFRIEGAVAAELEHADRFCEALLASSGVALAPGTAFGDHRWVRLTFAVPERQLDQGLRQLEEFVHANALETTP
jgi:aspartate aminotransferase